jgi:RHS repeat-associated protein
VTLDASDYSLTDPDRMSLRLLKSGGGYETLLSGGQEVFFVAGDGPSRISAQFDATDKSTGAYDYIAEVRNWWGSESQARTVALRSLVVNESASRFGWGWSIAGLQRLHLGRADGGIVVTAGDGSIAFFAQACTPNCVYASPAGDFSQLVRPDSFGYVRKYPDGTVYRFSANGLLENIATRWGDTTKFIYAADTLKEIRDPLGNAITLGYGQNGAYGAAGKIAWIRDPLGREVKFGFDAEGHLEKIVEPDGIVAFEGDYDSLHRLIWHSNRTRSRTDLTYDAHATIDSIKAPSVETVDAGPTRALTLVRSIERAALPASGAGTSLSNPASRVVPDSAYARLTSPRGAVSKTWIHRSGAPSRIAEYDPSGKELITAWERNADGLVKRVTLPSLAATTFSWDGSKLLSEYDHTLQLEKTYTYEGPYGLLKEVRVNGAILVTNYNDATLSRLDSAKIGASVFRYTYDSRGRRLTQKDPDNHETRQSYYVTGSQNTQWVATVRGGVERRTTYTYDAFGRPYQITDHAGRLFVTHYDTINRVRRVTGPDTSEIQYGYNDTARVYTTTDANGRVYRDSLNALGWLISRTDPRMKTQLFSYDRHGNVRSLTNRRGQTAEYTYDALDRVLTRTADGMTTTYAYDPDGMWRSVTNQESTDSIKLDGGGRVVSETSVRGTRKSDLYTPRDGLGRKSWLKHWAWRQVNGTWVASADSLKFGYNSAGSLASIGRVNSGFWKITGIVPTKDQLPNILDFPTGTTAGDRVKVTTNYTPGHLADQVTVNRTNLSFDVGRVHSYDILDQVTTIRQGTSADGRRRIFEYTPLGRLRTFRIVNYWEEEETICPDPYDDESCYQSPVDHADTLRHDVYQYDRVGNRRDKGAVLDTANRVTSFDGYSMTYDDDGNLLTKSKPGVLTQSFVWNTLGQLVQATTNGAITSFGYDGWGRRIRKSSSGGVIYYVYDGDRVVVEVDQNGLVAREYSYYSGVDRPHSVRSGGQTYYYLSEQPGSVTGLVNQSGQVVNKYEYSPFGETTIFQQQVSQPILFHGREYDAETKLYYVRARYYDPAVGRFISQDPIWLEGGINLYAFSNNAPTVGRDPSGTRVCIEGIDPSLVDMLESALGGASVELDPQGCVKKVTGGRYRVALWEFERLRNHPETFTIRWGIVPSEYARETRTITLWDRDEYYPTWGSVQVGASWKGSPLGRLLALPVCTEQAYAYKDIVLAHELKHAYRVGVLGYESTGSPYDVNSTKYREEREAMLRDNMILRDRGLPARCAY